MYLSNTSSVGKSGKIVKSQVARFGLRTAAAFAVTSVLAIAAWPQARCPLSYGSVDNSKSVKLYLCFPTVNVMAKVVDPQAKHWSAAEKNYVVGPVVSMGYSFIGDPPSLSSAEVNGTRLTIEWVCVIVFTAGTMFGIGTGQKDKTAPKGSGGSKVNP